MFKDVNFFYLYLNEKKSRSVTHTRRPYHIKVILSQERNVSRTFDRKMGRTTFERSFDRRYVFHGAGL